MKSAAGELKPTYWLLKSKFKTCFDGKSGMEKGLLKLMRIEFKVQLSVISLASVSPSVTMKMLTHSSV